jgi:outer membrane protein TolC
MSRHYLLSSCLGIGVAASIALVSGRALATQPLEAFLAAASQRNYDVRAQRSTVEQRDWEKESAFGKLLPAASARGVYSQNQYEAVLQGRTFIPYNQIDLYLQLDVPLVDLAAYSRLRQSREVLGAASAQLELSQNQAQRATALAYYAYIGASALVQAAERSVKIAEDNLAFVSTRRSLGAATELDQERARASLEQSKQDEANAEQLAVTNARTLETVSGLAPTPVVEYPIDDLHPEPGLEVWLGYRNTPADRVQAALTRAAEAGKKAAAYSLLPTLSGNAQERITNAPGFVPKPAYYTLQATLSWRFDYGTYATAQAQASALDLQRVQVEQTRRNVEDDIFNAWERVQTGIVKSASSRVQAESNVRAEELALARYQAGALTQLDVTTAQRDAFQAQANRIQADADLQYSRVLLRLAAGQPPRVQPSSVPPVQAKDLGHPPSSLLSPASPASASPAPAPSPAPTSPAPTPPAPAAVPANPNSH